MIILIEGIVMCFLLLITCVIGIANGPVGLVVLYEKDVQDRVVELGSRSRYTRYTLTTVIHYANQVLCAPSRPRYFHDPCASLTVIHPLVVSALLRPLAILLLLTYLFECLGHPRGSSTAHECLCINSLPQQSSPRNMIGKSPSAPFRITLQRD